MLISGVKANRIGRGQVRESKKPKHLEHDERGQEDEALGQRQHGLARVAWVRGRWL